MKKFLEIGGFIAGAVLVVFGVAAIVLGVNGRSTVNSSLKPEKIAGSPDMTPALIKQEAAGSPGLNGRTYASRPLVAGKTITAARQPAPSRNTCGSTPSRRPAV